MGTTVTCSGLDSNKLTLEPVLQQNLISPTTSKEIQKTLFDIDNDKASGPNGYGAKFFKSTWDTMNSNLQQAMKEFFAIGYLLK